jgi:hypothetical protein
VSQVRPFGGAPPMDVRLRSGPAKSPPWLSALVFLIAAAAVTVSLVVAAVGFFAALRIAHGYAGSIEHAATAIPGGGWRHEPGGRADREIPGAIAPVVARSDPTESEITVETGNMRNEAPVADTLPARIAEDSAPKSPSSAIDSAPADVSAVAAAAAAGLNTDTAADGGATGSIDRAAVATPAAPAATTAAAPHPAQHAKPHHAVKRHVVRKGIRRVARSPSFFGSAASPFQPTVNSARRAANSSSVASPFQPTVNPARRAANSSSAASPFQPMFGSP